MNENGLNYAEDDVEGVVYDFIITAAPAMDKRTVTIGANAQGRGTITLSQIADEYEKGTTITATATANSSNSFICWKEGNIIVSTDAEYTFTVDHNIALTAYFTPDTTDGDDIITGIGSTTATADIEIIAGEGYIQAVSSSPIASIAIYNSNAAQTGKSNGDKISTAGLAKGIYIVKVRTANGEKNFKFYNR
ncbi:MAG: T9SS type A sorting domain-containing protein [Alistipes sp.]|nr:T9SS type A sorting domain-containing protein [Alistipes sp.]